MAVQETSGVLGYKDESGELHIHYPVTKLENVDGAEEAIAAEAAAREQGLAGKAAASHAAQHAANGSDPITPQSIGAAPGGGGVMERALTIASTSSDDDYDAFCAKLDTILASMPNSSVKFLQVYPPQYYHHGDDMCALYKANNNYASVYTIGSYNTDRQGFRMIKNKNYSTAKWYPLEYINPEMAVGVEYRTTERYLGKPVYKKLVRVASVPAGKTTVQISAETATGQSIVSANTYSTVTGQYNNQAVVYVSEARCTDSGVTVTLTNNQNRTVANYDVLVAYTKC